MPRPPSDAMPNPVVAHALLGAEVAKQPPLHPAGTREVPGAPWEKGMQVQKPASGSAQVYAGC